MKLRQGGVSYWGYSKSGQSRLGQSSFQSRAWPKPKHVQKRNCSWGRWISPGTVQRFLETAKMLPGTTVFLGASDKRVSHGRTSHGHASHRRASHRRKSHRHTSLTRMHLSQARISKACILEAYISQDLHLRCLYLMGVALLQACILDAVTSGIHSSDKPSNCVPRYIPESPSEHQ